jgi:hypothetical protein
MTFSTFYDSNDTGLGGVSQSAGSLISFLDKVLVNGYNSTTLTSLTCSGSVVTATLAAHGYRDRQFITISGATPSGYNGTWQIITGSTTTNTFQFTITGSGLSAATGTLSCNVAPLGWSKPFSGTNLAAYRAPVGNRLYLRIEDLAITVTSARATTYESMSDINTGINPFYYTASGNFMPKASAAATRRAFVWGNGSTIYYFNDYTGDSSSGLGTIFGDFYSYKPYDQWNTCLISGNTASSTETFTVWTKWPNSTSVSFFASLAGHNIARAYHQMPGSVGCGKVADLRLSNNLSNGGAGSIGDSTWSLTYPMAIDGNLWTSPIHLNESALSTPRGYLPGIQAPMHNRPLTNYTFFTGSGTLAGKEFFIINCAGSGQILAEVSNTW